MKKLVRLYSVFFIISILLSGCSHGQKPPSDISSLLPHNDELENWKAKYESSRAAGENLYKLINGGAEVYHKFGFQEAISQEYEYGNGESINLEIFKMNSPEAALGIFSFKTGTGGTTFEIGDNALLEGYFLNFHKGEYLVTLTGYDQDQKTIEGILGLARIVEQKF